MHALGLFQKFVAYSTHEQPFYVEGETFNLYKKSSIEINISFKIFRNDMYYNDTTSPLLD